MEYIVQSNKIHFVGKVSEVTALIKEFAAHYETVSEMIEAEAYSSSVKKLPAEQQVKK